MMDWKPLISRLVENLEAQWPIDEDTDAPIDCQLCGVEPTKTAYITDRGPVHTHHDLRDVVELAVEVDTTQRTHIVRLAGWQIARVSPSSTHPDWERVETMDGASEDMPSADVLDTCLYLWGWPWKAAA